jgi:Sulfotransferase domain
MARERGAANDNYSNLPAPVAELAKAIVLAPRRLNASRRRLPDFLIIGAQRSGTTSLYKYLTANPGVEAAYPTKGAHYFDNHPQRSVGWYRAHFPIRREGGLITGEGSPYYLFHPQVPVRVARVAPDARLIVMLRDPVERAYSHYQQEYARGFEDAESFERALELEPQRLEGEQERMAADPGYRSRAHQHHSYIARGLYLEQIEAWRAHFAPEQMLILHTERFFADPASGMQEVQRFLGLDPAPAAEYPAHNARGYSPMDPATRRMLTDRFAEPNRRLYAYLGVDYGWGAQQSAVA